MRATLVSIASAVAFIALLPIQVSAQSPPGCLLGAINSYPNPADVSSVCSASDVAAKVSQFCGGDAGSALQSLSSICSAAGVSVATTTPTSTGASPTGSASGSVSTTGSHGSSGSSQGSATQTGSSASATGASASRTSAPLQSTNAAAAYTRVAIAPVLAAMGLGLL